MSYITTFFIITKIMNLFISLRFVSDVVTDNAFKYVQSVSGAERVGSFIKTVKREGTERRRILARGKDVNVKKINFVINEEIEEGIKNARLALENHIERLGSQVLSFSAYGSDLIKSSRISPDSFVQLAFLYTFYKVQGFVPNQYEAIMTKHFKHGRTAAGRAATSSAVKYLKAFDDKSIDRSELFKLLQDAASVHSKMVKRCASGGGVDRHLYALKCHWEKFTKGVNADFDQAMNEFFQAPGWQKLNVTLSSTSYCGNPSLKLFGFGPVAEEGVGVGYILGKRHLM